MQVLPASSVEMLLGWLTRLPYPWCEPNIIARTAPAIDSLERLVLIDTTAIADDPARRAGRHADIAKVRQDGIEALIPELPARRLLPAHAQRTDLTNLMAEMASSIGARGQFNQQTAMLARPEPQAHVAMVGVPT